MPGKESRDDDTSREEELAHLRDTFRGNGYPEGININLRKLPRTTCPQTKNQLPLIHPNSSCQIYICPGLVREHSECVQKDGNSNFSRDTLRWLLMNVQTPTPEMNRKEIVYQIPCQDCDSVMERLQVSRKKDNGAQICNKDWRPEEWSGGPCMGWRTQGGLGRSKDPWVRTTPPEEKAPRSHLDKDQQELKSGPWPCIKPDLAYIF